MEYPNNDPSMIKLRPFRSFLTFSATWLLTLSVLSQNSAKPLDLNAFADQKRTEFQKNKEAALEYAAIHNLPAIISTESTFAELINVSASNVPQYYSITNKNSAATISTDKLHTTSLSAYALDGGGITVYEWDAGSALTTHQELTGRVTTGDDAMVKFPFHPYCRDHCCFRSTG